MVHIQFQFPMRGANTNFAASTQPQFTSPRMMNVRPREVLGKRARGGQRPGLAKQYGQDLEGPVVAMCQVVTVEVS